jgi:hypothetical protein
MKKQFNILKDRPKVDIRITRDSVCAGDDCHATHEKTISIHSFLDPIVLASHLSSGYLPSVNGIGHTWNCVLNGKVIATISVNGIEPKVSEVVYALINHIHFVYNSAMY